MIQALVGKDLIFVSECWPFKPAVESWSLLDAFEMLPFIGQKVGALRLASSTVVFFFGWNPVRFFRGSKCVRSFFSVLCVLEFGSTYDDTHPGFQY